MPGWTGTLSRDQTVEVAATRQVICEGFKAALKAGVPKQKADILMDAQSGSPSPTTASSACTMTVFPSSRGTTPTAESRSL